MFSLVAKTTDVYIPCRPFSPLFLWYTGTEEDEIFFLQLRWLVITIRKLPENTRFSIVTIGAENNINMTFEKQTGQTNWRDIILKSEPGKTVKYTITYKEILPVISNHHRDDSNIAEIVYILVNNKTEIYGTENDCDQLRKKKTFVISSGIKAENKKNSWLKLATNEDHVVELNRKEDII